MDDIPAIFTALKDMGIAALPFIAALWWLERAERKAAQKENYSLLREVLTDRAQATAALDKVADTFAAINAARRSR